MKKLVVLALSVVAVSCNGIIGNGYEISGEIKGLADGTNAFLERIDEKTGMPVAIDTVKVEKGKFTFEGKANEPELHTVRFENTQGGFIVILEKGNINAKVNKDSITHAKVSGTYNNDEFNKYSASMLKIQKEAYNFQDKNLLKMKEAQEKKDTVVVNQLRKEYSKIQEKFEIQGNKYIEESPKSFVSVLLIKSLFNSPMPDMAKIKKYFDALDSSVKETAAGKNIKTKIEEFEKKAGSKKN